MEETSGAQEVQAAAQVEVQEAKPEKTFTQEDVNNIVAKEAARAAKKAVKEQPAPDPELEARVKAADERLLAGTVLSLAAEMGVTDRGAKAAQRLTDFSACRDKDGNLEEEAVKKALEGFLKEYPEFAKPGPGGFVVGAPRGNGQASSREISEIFGNVT